MKHGDGYRAAVWNPATRKKEYSKTVAKKQDAKKLEVQLMKRIESGKDATARITVQSAYEMWLESVQKNVAERTRDAYLYNWKHYCFDLKDLIVQKLTPIDLMRWRNKLESVYAAETVNKVLSLVSMVLDFCRDVLRVIEISPAEHIPRCKVKTVVHQTWTLDEIREFLDYAKRSPYYAPLALICSTGMRPGECCGLLESDLNTNGSIILHRGLNNHGRVTEMKTERSHRTIALSPQMVSVLREYIQYKHRAGCLRAELFVSGKMEPLRPDVLSNQFRAVLGRFNASHSVQLPVIRLYDIRHSFATNCLMDGAKSKLVSEVMGNSVNTMEHHYAHLRETMHENLLKEYGEKII